MTRLLWFVNTPFTEAMDGMEITGLVHMVADTTEDPCTLVFLLEVDFPHKFSRSSLLCWSRSPPTSHDASRPTSNASRSTSNAPRPTSNASRTTSNAPFPTSNASSRRRWNVWWRSSRRIWRRSWTRTWYEIKL